MNTKKLLSTFTIFTSLVGTSALANTGEMYGFGSRSSAMANTVLGSTQDAFATYYNPAINSSNQGLRLSYGVQYAHPEFKDIRGVTVANSATAAVSSDQIGDVDTDSYLDHLGQAIGASLNLGEGFKNLTLGLTGFMPLSKVAYLDTGEAFLPEYFSYRSRTQRPQLYASLGATPLKHVHVGTGIAFSTNLASAATMKISGANNSVSYARFSSTIKPGAAPYFSIYTDPEPIEAGLTVRMPNRYDINIDTTAEARLIGPTNDLPLILNLASPMYYDPFEIDLGAGYHLTPATFLTAEVDWLQYSEFKSPSLQVTNKGSAIDVRGSISNLPNMQDIFVPKVGVEHKLNSTALRAGYFYRPSPVKDNFGPGNLVDPAKHVFTAGFGIDLKKAGIIQKHQVYLDAHAQYHWLIEHHVLKAGGNEVGTAGQTKIGAPGYDIGGHIYAGGVSLTMAL